VRIFASRRATILVVLGAAILPRLAALLYARDAILAGFVEKSDIFARTLLASGTYGYVPGVPSAYTQPLYGWFLAGVYWIAARDWEAVGIAQILVAAGTATIVFAAARRFLSLPAAALAAVVATLNPYLIWHDVHVNREILDQLLAAAMFLLALAAARRGALMLSAALGVACGLAILGNSRLLLFPLVLAAFVVWRLPPRRAAATVAVVVAATVAVLAPWVIRNRVQVGCWAITTDARALWKANNVNTYATLKAGKWIDDVPPLPGAPRLTPEYESDILRENHRIVRVDECAQESLYTDATLSFWRHHPVEKLRLIGLATHMLWSPVQTRTEGGPQTAGTLRRWIEAFWAIPVYVLAVLGLFLVPRRILALGLIFLGYETLEAWLFAGATRYRISFDFVLALFASASLAWAFSRLRYRRSTASAVAPAEN
jgi:4-amino-4-deoxy-L-arabinose transferase-like glycosyltransferase